MDQQANEPRPNQRQIAPARKRKARLDDRKTGKSIDPERLMKAIRYAMEHPSDSARALVSPRKRLLGNQPKPPPEQSGPR